MYINRLSIKNWAEESRPREKMMSNGRQMLTISELIAILLGSGTKEKTAVAVAEQVLLAVDNDLSRLARWEVADFTQIKGIGEARAITLIAAMELARRRDRHHAKSRPVITSSGDVYSLLKDKMLDLSHEEFWVILMNRKNAVIRTRKVSSGGVAGTVVDPKMVFKYALQELACGMILAHNHPSGNLRPSEEDLRLTKTIQSGGDLLAIKVFDHLIFTDDGYFSFVDEGKM